MNWLSLSCSVSSSEELSPIAFSFSVRVSASLACSPVVPEGGREGGKCVSQCVRQCVRKGEKARERERVSGWV